MNNRLAILALLLLSPCSLAQAQAQAQAHAQAQGNADAVNERIPVKNIEKEAHWGVNCIAAWENLQAAAAPVGAENCGISGQLLHEIQLCAFIYQPPGENSQRQYPDYQCALQRLRQATTLEQCQGALTDIRRKKGGCAAAVQQP